MKTGRSGACESRTSGTVLEPCSTCFLGTEESDKDHMFGLLHLCSWLMGCALAGQQPGKITEMLFSPETSKSEPFVCHPTDRGRMRYHPGSQGRLPESLGAFLGGGDTPEQKNPPKQLPGVELGWSNGLCGHKAAGRGLLLGIS